MITWDIIVLFVYRFLVINAIFSVILVTADSAVPDVSHHLEYDVYAVINNFL